MSREAFPQPRPPEALPPDPKEGVLPPTTSLRMAQAVTQLATAYGVDLAQKGASLQLDLPDHAQRWLIGPIDDNRIGVTRASQSGGNLSD